MIITWQNYSDHKKNNNNPMWELRLVNFWTDKKTFDFAGEWNVIDYFHSYHTISKSFQGSG